MTGQGGYTTVTVTRDTHRRLDDLKPYESMSYDEFLSELADDYETQA
jgi:hypothetical protein